MSLDPTAFPKQNYDVLHKVLFGMIVLMVLAGGILGYYWVQSHGDAIRAQAQADARKEANEASQKQIDTLQQQVQALQDSDKIRAEEEAKTLAAMQVAVAKVVTPQQVAQWIPQQLVTPQPIKIDVTPPSASNPTGQVVATMTSADLQAIRDQIETCKECGVKLAAANETITSKTAQVENTKTELTHMTAERDVVQKESDDWKRAAKGGSFVKRAAGFAEHAMVGAAVTGLVICGTGHCK